MAEFDGWAEFYDVIHDGIPGDVEFYVAEAAQAGGPVLEIGAGTGRITIPMASAGAMVTGLDISGAMLDICRRRAQEVNLPPGRVTLAQGDMRDFKLSRRFRLVVMPYRAFMHLLTPDDQVRCLTCVRKHLDPDGRLILDTWKPDCRSIAMTIGGPVAAQLKQVGLYPGLREGRKLRHYQSSSCDEFDQILTERHVIQETDLAGNVLREIELPLVRSWTHKRELNHLVNLCGYRVEAVYGDYDRTPLVQDSIEMIWMLRNV